MTKRDVWPLIARHLAGEASAADEAELHAWAQAPENARVLAEARQAWLAAARDEQAWDVDAAWRRVQPSLGEAPTDMRGQRRAGRMWPFAAGSALLAASLAAVLVLGQRAPTSDEAVFEYATGAEQTETVRMDDGTVVRLGPASRLRVTGARSVRLDGLAFFAVEGDPAAPFVVELPAGGVRVLGTRFEVRTTGDSARVTVIEGRVEVSGADATIELTAGEVTQVVRGGDPEPATTVNPPSVADWMGRTLIFQSTPLAAAAGEIEAMYGVRVQIAPEIRSRTLTALFTDEPIDRLVPTLCRAVEASCTLSDTLVMVEAQP